MSYKTRWPGEARQREMEWAFYFSLQILMSTLLRAIQSVYNRLPELRKAPKQQSKLEIGMVNY